MSTAAGPSSQGQFFDIDPALQPLPVQDVEELSDLYRHKPVSKKGGARRPISKGKGKAREVPPSRSLKRKRELSSDDEDTDEDDEDAVMPKKGRARGASNYRDHELNTLFNIVEKELPISEKGWKLVAKRYAKWAEENDRPVRSYKALENKFKGLVRTSKPTGSGKCPPAVDRAHEIEDKINERVETRDVNDEDLADDVDTRSVILIDDDGGDKETTSQQSKSGSKRTRHAIAVKVEEPLVPTAVRHARPTASAGMEVLSRLTQSLDPSVQAARDTERATRSLHTTQIMALNQQVRDLNSTIDELRREILQSERQRQDAERRADRAEYQTEITRVVNDLTGGRRGRSRTRSMTRSGYSRRSLSRPHFLRSPSDRQHHPRSPGPSRHRHESHSARHQNPSNSPPRRKRYDVEWHNGRERFWAFPYELPDWGATAGPDVDRNSVPISVRCTTDSPSFPPDRIRERPPSPDPRSPISSSRPRHSHTAIYSDDVRPAQVHTTSQYNYGPISANAIAGSSQSSYISTHHSSMTNTAAAGPSSLGLFTGGLSLSADFYDQQQNLTKHVSTPSEWSASPHNSPSDL